LIVRSGAAAPVAVREYTSAAWWLSSPTMSSLLTVSTQTPLKFGLGSETVRSGAGSAACATAGTRKASRPTTPAPAASQAQRHFSHEPTAGTPSSLIPFFPPVRHGRGQKTDVQRQSSDFIKYIGRSKACQVQTTNARAHCSSGSTACGAGTDRPVSPLELDESGRCWLRLLRPARTFRSSME